MLTSFIEYHRNKRRSDFTIPMIRFSPMVVYCRFCCLTQINTACRKRQMLKERGGDRSNNREEQVYRGCDATHARQ